MLKKFLLLMALGISLGGCGKESQQKQIYNDLVNYYPGDKASKPNIKFASSLSSDGVNALSEDFEFLRRINMTPANSADLVAVMKINDSSPKSLVSWLDDRMQYVVPKDFDADKSAYLSSIFIPDSPMNDDSKTGTVMASNIGAAVYMSAAEQGRAAFVQIPGFGDVHVSSPRVGIIQEGDGLFTDMIGEGHLDDVPHILLRLSTFFHEARHSDGNGQSLCFTHSVCPSGHDYEGLYACDNNGNGPYRIEAELVKAFANTCSGCSPRTLELFKMMEADSFSRMLSKDNWNDSPQGSR